MENINKYPRVFWDSNLNVILDFENATKLFKTYNTNYKCYLTNRLISGNNRQRKFLDYWRATQLPQLCIDYTIALKPMYDYFMNEWDLLNCESIGKTFKVESEKVNIPKPFSHYISHNSICNVKNGKKNHLVSNHIQNKIAYIYPVKVCHLKENQYSICKSFKYWNKKKNKMVWTTMRTFNIDDRYTFNELMDINSINNICFMDYITNIVFSAKSIFERYEKHQNYNKTQKELKMLFSNWIPEIKNKFTKYNNKLGLNILDKFTRLFKMKWEQLKMKETYYLNCIANVLTRLHKTNRYDETYSLENINYLVKNASRYLNSNQMERLFLSHREFQQEPNVRTLINFYTKTTDIIVELEYDKNNKMC